MHVFLFHEKKFIEPNPLTTKFDGNLPMIQQCLEIFFLQAKEYLDLPDVMSKMVDPELKHFREDDLKVICEVASLCIKPNPLVQLTMQELCTVLESRIDTSVSSEIQASSLAWAELALSP